MSPTAQPPSLSSVNCPTVLSPAKTSPVDHILTILVSISFDFVFIDFDVNFAVLLPAIAEALQPELGGVSNFLFGAAGFWPPGAPDLFLVWQDRNLLLNGSRLSDIDVMIDKGFRWVEDYDKAQACTIFDAVGGFVNDHWAWKGRKGNENGCYLHCDAAVRDSEINLRGWIRNSKCLVVAIFASHMSSSFSPTLAEAFSIQFGLRFAATLGVKIQQVTRDWHEAEQGLIAKDSHHPLEGILSNILTLFDSIDCGLCEHTKRLHNEIAHAIVKWAVEPKTTIMWSDCIPIS
ncbi:ribonuclease H [Striga asiatica]|uniref:Ribonuclease H n=1 Tax=Striga asiatica TaxID=4170 RepID=A0A5A7PAT4_STRAF|nr:ribonuclease H [Striga asiatica]